MYLEKLEIHGFKSFASKNKLIFSGLLENKKRGLTAIVGPNGSGKSNVADAVRWVLGEQSLKTLRGKKSEDVIFSGSDKKNQLGMAEVSLYLNNTETVKVNLNKSEASEVEKESDLDQIISTCAEIVITRRIYRSGESEYLLNNNRVRLVDIQMLLAKANFGQKTYSVIGQGMVENFLSSSAAERKDFFDEATGVKQFQIKRDSALNKLESSYENLQQVDMLLAEIKPRLKSLTRQVEKLKHREELEKELKDTQFNYYGFLFQDINIKLESANEKYLNFDKTKLEKEKKLEKHNEELNKIRSTDNFREINELSPRLKELENQKNQLLKQLSRLQAELEMQLEAQGQFDLSWLNNKQGELSAELENISSEINSLEKNKQSKEEDNLQAELNSINKEIEQARNIRLKIENLEGEKTILFKQISKLEATLEANLEVQGQFDVSWLNNKNEELSQALSQLNKDLAELNQENNPDKKQNLSDKLQSIQNNLDGLNRELAEINKEIKKSGQSENKGEEISALIDEFLRQLDVIDEEKDLEKIKKLIAKAKNEFQEKIKELIGGVNSEKINRVKEIQEEIIALTEKRQLATDDLNEERMRLSTINERLRLSTDRQFQISRELSEIKIKLEKAEIKFDASKIEDEKREINKKIENINKEIGILEKDYKFNELQEKKQSADASLQEYRLKLSSLNERLRLLLNKREQIEKEVTDIKTKIGKSQNKFDASGIEREKEEINKQLEKIGQEIKTLENKLEALNLEKEKEKSIMFECQKNIHDLQQEINSINNELNNLKVESTRQETKLEDLEANIRGDELSVSDISKYKLADGEIDLDRLKKNLVNYKNQLEQIGGIDPETEKEYNETKERYDFLSAQVNDLNQAIKSLEEIIYELDINIKSRFDSEFRIISEKFNEYFKILFNGGSAKISKVLAEDIEKEENKNVATNSETNNGMTSEEIEIKKETNDKLKKIKFLKKNNAAGLAGIEVQAIPPGKKIQTVTMLSGGERALTAIALICAIISANPSPFVFLDEVDAALDEANSERLAQILDDLSNKTQFIVITHNRASMRKASILYGVTMEDDGVSKLLSVKLDELKNKE